MDYQVEVGQLSERVKEEAGRIAQRVASPAWYLIDHETDYPVADVAMEPTGEITMPSRISASVGESKSFIFTGTNTSDTTQVLKISAIIFDPYDVEAGSNEYQASVPSGAKIQVTVTVTLNTVGTYYAGCFLYAEY